MLNKIQFSINGQDAKISKLELMTVEEFTIFLISKGIKFETHISRRNGQVTFINFELNDQSVTATAKVF